MIASAHQLNLRLWLTTDCNQSTQLQTTIVDHWQSPVQLALQSSPAPNSENYPVCQLWHDTQLLTSWNGFTSAFAFWQKIAPFVLTDNQLAIAYQSGTERPFSCALNHEKNSGIYADPLTGVPLFTSTHKYDSGSGWPSFFTPIQQQLLSYHTDSNLGMQRTEVKSQSSGIHLGHVFDDGPPPTGKRYCINGAVLHFMPTND